ncbi:MAG: hypothetical protein AAFQ50_13015, partial [Pseudomonadota bacterium]
MSDIANKLADELARKAIAHLQATGDEDVVTMITKAIGDSSQTLQEAFITSVRIQRAAIRAEEMLHKRMAEFGSTPPRPDPSNGVGPIPSGMAESAAAPFDADMDADGKPASKRIFSRPLLESETTEDAPEPKKKLEPSEVAGPWDL